MSRFSLDLTEIGRGLTAPLLVVMPIYNEEANIAEVISNWSLNLQRLQLSFQIVALDDGSRDGTHRILLELERQFPDVFCVVHKPNSGHGITCRMGYDIAVASNAEWLLQIDSDGQCDPAHFADFWARRAEKDCVFGVRTNRGDGVARLFTSGICWLASSIICGQNLRDPNVPYRLMRRETLQRALRFIPASFNIHNVALTYVLKKLPNVRWDYVPITFPDRKGGTNSINVLKVVTWGAEMLFELMRIRVRSDLPSSR
jgi:glycosyltransferase involved in cell wall biosynthesis